MLIISLFILLLAGPFIESGNHLTKEPEVSAFVPGDTVPEEYLRTHGVDAFFHIDTISSTLFLRIKGKSYKPNCTTPLKDLRYLRVLHRNIEGKTLVGEMILNRKIAADVLDILRQLYNASYPIEKMRLIDDYDANDLASARANNSSGFNFRFVSHTQIVSMHGKGMAVDINPFYNPYFRRLPNGKEILEPEEARNYLDRNARFPYKISRGDLCHQLFTQHGFSWGGAWKSCKDYQHFEKK